MSSYRTMMRNFGSISVSPEILCDIDDLHRTGKDQEECAVFTVDGTRTSEFWNDMARFHGDVNQVIIDCYHTRIKVSNIEQLLLSHPGYLHSVSLRH